MKIEISLFDAQLNAFFTIVKSFSWANAYAAKCNPQLNAFFTTWRGGEYGSLTKPQDSGAATWLNAPYMMTATDLTGLMGLTGLDGPDWFCRAAQKQAPGLPGACFLAIRELGKPSY